VLLYVWVGHRFDLHEKITFYLKQDGLARTGRVFLFYFDNDLPSKKLKEDSISHVLALFIV
jgi:hypothetical protein